MDEDDKRKEQQGEAYLHGFQTRSQKVGACDGRVVFLAIQNEREWVRFCQEVLDRPELVQDPRFGANPDRVRHRRELEEIIREAFARLTMAEVESRLVRAQIAYAEMRTVKQFIEHPQLRARDRWRSVSSPVGELVALLPPVTLRGEEPSFGDIPVLGQHTRKVLSELGYSDQQIAELHARGVVKVV